MCSYKVGIDLKNVRLRLILINVTRTDYLKKNLGVKVLMSSKAT